MLSRPRSATVLLPLFCLLVPGCGPTPEAAGDDCDPDGDPCPSGMVCAPGGDDHICQIKPGQPCDPGATDYCVGDSICSDDGNGSGICGTPEGGECDPVEPFCTGTLTCEPLEDGGHACFPPVRLSGRVFDAQSDDGIEGAHVLAFDAQATALTDVAESGPEGAYELSVPVPRRSDGAPVSDFIVTLRASAQDYQTFPGGLRTALPIQVGSAVAEEDGWRVESTLTDIALLLLPAEQQGLTSIAGTVLAGDDSGGVLVVAEGAGGGISAVSGKSGGYTIFNVPDGSYALHGYAANVQIEPRSVDVAGQPVVDADLVASDEATGTISGSINIVNAPGGSQTSVVLVVASTFSDTFVRGEVPRGLRTPLSGPPSIDGAFEISGVPAGDYVVLAAFENDDLVRDPDPNIAGTQIVTVSMDSPGSNVTLDSSFKITEALAVLSPGTDDAEAVSAAPTLTWADDSSEDFYTVVVYNAFGDLVWCRAPASVMADCDGGEIPSVSGNSDVTVDYGGPLEAGMYYQFRATSWRQPGGNPEPGAISTTEDLRGVFFLPAGE